MKMFKLTTDPITAQMVIDAVSIGSAGAIVAFLGTVRDNSLGREVLYLEYDAYPGMTEKMMQKIADEIYEKWQIDRDRVAITHRTGRLEIGEVSVAIAVAAPHRKVAFEACQYAIDRLKQTVPIWKREVWKGGEEWVQDAGINKIIDGINGTHKISSSGETDIGDDRSK